RVGDANHGLAQRIAEVRPGPLQQQSRQNDEQGEREQRVDDEDQRAHGLAFPVTGRYRIALRARGCVASLPPWPESGSRRDRRTPVQRLLLRSCPPWR